MFCLQNAIIYLGHLWVLLTELRRCELPIFKSKTQFIKILTGFLAQPFNLFRWLAVNRKVQAGAYFLLFNNRYFLQHRPFKESAPSSMVRNFAALTRTSSLKRRRSPL